jgi:hypothetical protein
LAYWQFDIGYRLGFRISIFGFSLRQGVIRAGHAADEP